MNNKKLVKNLILSLCAQAVSLLTSLIVGMVVPRFIDEYQYAYWQVFVLYFGYVGIFHFGLLDGILLKYAQYDYEQLDKARLRSQFGWLLAITSTVSVLISGASLLALGGVYVTVGVLVAIGVIIRNVFTYTSFTFQMTNRINHYAVLVAGQRILYGVIVVGLLCFRVNNFAWYCIADILSEAVASLIASIYNRGLYFGKTVSFKEGFFECWSNVSAGIFLTLANLSGMLLVGSAKMVIQWRWDELVFGKLAFSFSITNLFIAFITAMSVVLFPSLKRMKEEEIPKAYPAIRGLIVPFLFIVLIAYFPACQILKIWLPKYTESLGYLGILLPLIIFSSKNSLLTNNYLKVYRKERLMLLINACSVGIGFGVFLVCAYALNNIELMLYAIIAVLMLSSVVSELVVMRVIKQVKILPFLIEAVMTVAFILSTKMNGLWWGMALYALALLGYAVLNGRSIIRLYNNLKNKKKAKERAQENLYGQYKD